ncbi:DegT/DnrJ/EryC1/StrS family aminotransferase [Streptomyces lonarensis]|uniref:DegT/DnrJ/EryC1/StrS family aminotransferase n=1 Tax=Streptomyces lonarensis TaxID=700599 RepID=A0A7X6CX52_9ACTN|nr:DegT/DnrJ/EryC1/StrS family aminotransferase [Streptomyces lonarensis]NJQ04024.1 DegT/DnrJ/EryC1/StrS family aminotransferase [Streptomyces lonarensis]
MANGSGVIGELERRIEHLLGLPNPLSFSSGTAGLHAAYLALDLPPGSEVIGPVNTFHASVSPALHCGLNVLLVDVQPDTGNLCPAALEAAITPLTRCVTVTHHLGHPAAMEEITRICRRRGLYLIEDISHAYLSTLNGQPVGTFGDICVGSMQDRKSWSAGEGGLFSSPHPQLRDRAVLAGHYRGRALALDNPELAAYGETGLGLKMRMHPLAAVVGLANAEGLPERLASRRALLERLGRRLVGLPGVRPPVVRPGASMGGWFSYRPQIQLDELRPGVTVDAYLARVQDAGVPAHYPSIGSLAQMPLFSEAVPLRAAARTWRPRRCGPFHGETSYSTGRISVSVAEGDTEETIDAYGDAFADVSRALADGPVAA